MPTLNSIIFFGSIVALAKSSSWQKVPSTIHPLLPKSLLLMLLDILSMDGLHSIPLPSEMSHLVAFWGVHVAALTSCCFLMLQRCVHVRKPLRCYTSHLFSKLFPDSFLSPQRCNISCVFSLYNSYHQYICINPFTSSSDIFFSIHLIIIVYPLSLVIQFHLILFLVMSHFHNCFITILLKPISHPHLPLIAVAAFPAHLSLQGLHLFLTPFPFLLSTVLHPFPPFRPTHSKYTKVSTPNELLSLSGGKPMMIISCRNSHLALHYHKSTAYPWALELKC